ncbi:MAG: deoxyribose-phosphate aldolase [Treponemataceae bacterium]|nr:deoxyribose-phosphate aldolase [Treponemataceae bacterium]
MKISKYIDNTNLKSTATREDIKSLCQESIQYDFASVCVNAFWVPLAYQLLKDSDVNVCTVVGFPLGATSSESKAFEAKTAVENGASEIDMVMNIGLAKNGEWEKVYQDIKAVVEASKKADEKALVKVILETCCLTDEEIVRACQECEKAGADFVKTSTGFASEGAKVEDVALMKKTVGDRLKVKAAGGIRDKETALAMIEAGADRLGTSSGKKIIS